MLEALSLPFFQRVLAAGLLASVACGVIGTYVVAKRITGITGGLAHASFGGVGLGYLLGFSPMLGAAGFGLVSGVAIGLAYRHMRSSLDMLISTVWAVGMALGILFVSLTPGYAPDLTSYLFGSLLFVPWEYVGLVALLDTVIVATVLLLYKEFKAVVFDEEFAEVVGVPVEPIFLLLLALTSLAVVTLIRVVGVILAIALLTMPAAIGRQWSDTLARIMVIAVAVSAFATTAGLFGSFWLSATFDVSAPPGPLTILIATALYGLSSASRSFMTRGR
ncbi:MAG: metal ABC transporter permease [Myxococcales bacterium]|jgi:zinc transport system permease protein|nr:MAG: metal ABC transporter permease [Myxococcales bacterium]